MLSYWAFPRIGGLGIIGVSLDVVSRGLPQGGAGWPRITGSSDWSAGNWSYQLQSANPVVMGPCRASPPVASGRLCLCDSIYSQHTECLFMCVGVCVFIYLFFFLCVCRVSVWGSVCLWGPVRVLYVCVCVCACVHVCVCAACACVYVCACVRLCMCPYILASHSI